MWEGHGGLDPGGFQLYVVALRGHTGVRAGRGVVKWHLEGCLAAREEGWGGQGEGWKRGQWWSTGLRRPPARNQEFGGAVSGADGGLVPLPLGRGRHTVPLQAGTSSPESSWKRNSRERSWLQGRGGPRGPMVGGQRGPASWPRSGGSGAGWPSGRPPSSALWWVASSELCGPFIPRGPCPGAEWEGVSVPRRELVGGLGRLPWREEVRGR